MELRKVRTVRIPGGRGPNLPSSTPIVTNWGIFTAHEDGDLVCLNRRSLALEWSSSANRLEPLFARPQALFAMGPEGFFHLDPNTGAKMRTLRLDSHDFGFTSDAIVSMSRDVRELVFYDLDTFEEVRRLQFQHDPRIDFPSDPRVLLAMADRFLLFGRATVAREFRDPVVAFDATTGSELWAAELKAQLRAACSPEDLAGPYQYCGTWKRRLFLAKGRVLCAFELDSGRLAWSATIPQPAPAVSFGHDCIRLWSSWGVSSEGRYSVLDADGRVLLDTEIRLPNHVQLSGPMRPFDWGDYVCLVTYLGYLLLVEPTIGTLVTWFGKPYIGTVWLPCDDRLLHCFSETSVIHVVQLR